VSRLTVFAVAGLLRVASAQEPADPVAGLVAQLESRDPKVRVQAARSLGKRGGEQAIRALGKALDDEAAPVRHEAAIALARLAPDESKSVGVLAESLRSGDWYVRWQACLALRLFGPRAEGAVPDLIRVLGDAKLDNGREATLALGAIAPRDPAVVSAMVKALDAQPAVDRRAVVLALHKAGQVGHAIPWLAREAHGNEHGRGDEARRLLERVVPDHAEFYLLLFDPDEERRVRGAGWFSGSAKHLYEWKEMVVPSFVEALKDESSQVRSRILEALDKLGEYANVKAAIPYVLSSAVSKEDRERQAAGQVLETIAPSLACVIEVHAAENKENVWVATLHPSVLPPGGASKLLALLTDPAVGDATLAELARITSRTKEDLLAAVRAEMAKEKPKPAK
jgi:HEAT repeat protein